jgi:hypothetical protein
MLGRDTLIEGGLVVVLDGSTKTTRFFEPVRQRRRPGLRYLGR